MKQNDELDLYIQERLFRLQTFIPRDPQNASVGRERYLVQVNALVQEQTVAPTVSATPFRRLKKWISVILNPLIRKERFSMITTLTTVLVAISMLFGGASATVYAAQDSLPDDLLYPVKTFSEDCQLILTKSPQRQLDLLMAFTDRRIDEIVTKRSTGEPIPEILAVRFQHELNHMFRIVAGMDDAPMSEALEYIGIHIRRHDREMDRIRVKQLEQPDPVMEQVREMIRSRIILAELGLEDPVAFRGQVLQFMNGSDLGPGPANQSETIMPDEGYGPGPGRKDIPICEDCPREGNGSGFGPGPENQDDSIMPDEGYGPGPAPMDTPICEDCPREGNGNGFGPGPENQDDSIMPDEGYGPGPVPMDTPICEDCPREGNGNGFGPGPENQDDSIIPDEDDGPGHGSQGPTD